MGLPSICNVNIIRRWLRYDWVGYFGKGHWMGRTCVQWKFWEQSSEPIRACNFQTEKDTPGISSVIAGRAWVQMKNDINKLWETWDTKGGIWLLWEVREWKIWLSLQSYLQNNRWKIILLFIHEIVLLFSCSKFNFHFRCCLCSKACFM